MSDDKGGRELTPRGSDEVQPSGGELTPVEGDSRAVERFSAGPRAHSVELTEERAAQIVRQSGNARSVVFLAILAIAIFIPVYWFYESGIPAAGVEGRLAAEAEDQFVTDVERGYEIYIANCAECHGAEGQGGVGPRLNDQAKLYNVLTPAGQSGSGHLNPDYLDNVLTVGGRYVCGDPNSLMASWKEPNGPLNYRQVEELIAWITASNQVIFEVEPESHGAGEEAADSVTVAGWRDPAWQPGPEDTPVPACWKAPAGLVPAGTASTTTPTTDATAAPTGGEEATPAPAEGGSAGGTRVVRLNATSSLQFTDEGGAPVPQIQVAPGETIEFVIDNTANFDHNFWIGTPDVLGTPNAETDTGIPTWQSGEQTVTWTAPSAPGTLQFACTVPGHYSTMQGSIVIGE